MSQTFSGEAWLEEETARRYKVFTEKTTMYQDLSRYMQQLADIRPGMVVADLGCGTGVTTQAVLAALNHNGRIYAIDISGPMLAVAREEITSPQVTFVQADAAACAPLIDVPVDRVVCNSVFWQFRHKPDVLAELRKMLVPGGLFVFNLPEPYFIFEYIPRGDRVSLLFKQLAAERYGVGQQDQRTIEVFLNGQGFEIVSRHEFSRQRSSEESYLFTQIPVATAWMDPPLSYKTRLALLEEARGLASPDPQIKQRWMYFVTRLAAPA